MKSKLNVFAVLAVVLLWSSGALATDVNALFDTSSPRGGPFPSDVFTTTDPTHNTGVRVNLPLPDCVARPTDCRDLGVINTLDGFNVQPRLAIPFDGPIDPSTATSQTILIVSLGDALPNGDTGGRVIGINQVVWDPLTNTLYAESDELLNQHTRYALIVTNGLRNLEGSPVNASEAFLHFRNDLNFGQTHDFNSKAYRKVLLDALQAARLVGVQDDNVVSASVFTTQSVTSTLEKIRDQIKSATPAPADFNIGPGGTRTVFSLNGVSGITFNQQTRDNPALFTAFSTPLSLLNQFTPGAVAQVAFGKYLSPDYQVHPGEFMPETGTLTGTPVAQSVNQIYFNLFLPSGPKPAQGWPVAIFGHGGTGTKDIDPYTFAASMASQGIATIAINFVGRGFGPLGTLKVNLSDGSSVTFVSGGRGFDQDGNGIIAADEGAAARAPRQITGQRDAIRQTVVDLMQLVREIQVGVDADGDSSPDLDSSRMSYFGWSFGGGIGVAFLAIEPNVGLAALNNPGAAAGRIDLLRLRPAARSGIGATLASRTPSLINVPGLTSFGGISVGPPFFNENLPLRNQPVVVNDIAGAIDIQQVFENSEWASESGDAAAYASHLLRDPLPTVPVKLVMLQLAKGDITGTNPRTTAIIRAGSLADHATFYRNDLAFLEDPTVPKDPHTFLTNLTRAGIAGQIAHGGQMQVATFLSSQGGQLIFPEPVRFFEVPIVLPLPEDLSFIP
jgi:Bacterial virulence factor lipase N-terminal